MSIKTEKEMIELMKKKGFNLKNPKTKSEIFMRRRWDQGESLDDPETGDRHIWVMSKQEADQNTKNYIRQQIKRAVPHRDWSRSED